MAKRGKTLEDKYIGPEPLFTGDEDFTDMGLWQKAAQWYNYYYQPKDYQPDLIRFCKEYCKYDKKKIAIVKKIKDWRFMSVHKKIKLHHRGWSYTPEQLDEAKDFIEDLVKVERANIKIEEKKPKPPVIPPAERTRQKVIETIYNDWDEIIVDQWFDKNFEEKFHCYSRFKGHKLKGNAIDPFLRMIEPEYNVIKDAYTKSCDQAVEAYAHLTKGEKRKMMKQFEDCFDDLEKLRNSFRAVRTTSIKKRKSSDAQVAKLKYCEEDVDNKLTSINPILIPGKSKLYVYNRKNRKLMQYTTTATDGFLISGTSIKNFDDASKQATLRKPEDILPDVLNKTELQISKLWDKITTKVDKPNGRLNADCILMRVF